MPIAYCRRNLLGLNVRATLVYNCWYLDDGSMSDPFSKTSVCFPSGRVTSSTIGLWPELHLFLDNYKCMKGTDLKDKASITDPAYLKGFSIHCVQHAASHSGFPGLVVMTSVTMTTVKSIHCLGFEYSKFSFLCRLYICISVALWAMSFLFL